MANFNGTTQEPTNPVYSSGLGSDRRYAHALVNREYHDDFLKLEVLYACAFLFLLPRNG